MVQESSVHTEGVTHLARWTMTCVMTRDTTGARLIGTDNPRMENACNKR